MKRDHVCSMLGIPLARQAGASLVELIIVVTIVAVLLGMGVPMFQEWMVNTRIRTASDSMLNGLQVARAEAIKRNRYVDFRLDGVAGAWQVVSAPGNAICPVVADPGPAADDILQRRSAQEGAQGLAVATNDVNALRVTFTPMGMVTVACGAPFATLEVTSDVIAAPRLLRVVVGPTGGMRMCEPSRPANDPRACP